MSCINLMDCTLRDGGYINNWNFGYKSIKSILNYLAKSGVEFIECGYLSEKKGGDCNCTQYKDFEALFDVLPENTNDKQKFAVMIDFGQYDINAIPEAKHNSPVIRVCFHKKDVDNALDYCKRLKNKGYSVFVQPMASLNYSDIEFVELINRVNILEPYGFYIVDSFGVIEIEDFQRLLFLTDHNLGDSIILGYHAHNNLQQAYGNAKYMVEQSLKHDVVLDASVYGMGRGAGNLNMELFASYLNRYFYKSYDIDSFLNIMDEYIKPIFSEKYWGYSLPFYLSARYNCHPNYAGYYAEKNTLTNKSMRQLLSSIPEDVKDHYSPEIAEQYYQDFQKKYVDDSGSLDAIKNSIIDRKVLILAPGKTLLSEKEKIEDFIINNVPVIFAINVIPESYTCDYLFCSNEKRLNNLPECINTQLIVSSNIARAKENSLVVNYSSYLSDNYMIADNPAIMLMRIFSEIGLKQVYIAGFDGYNASAEENYYDSSLALGTSLSVKLQKNTLIREEINKIKNLIEISFLTSSKYK